MPSSEQVTHWVGRLKEGDPQAPQRLWEAYYQALVALARTKLTGTSRRVADEEDVALSAFASFCRGAERNRFPQLADRTDLWRVLVVITRRKAADLATHQKRLKRGGPAQTEVGASEVGGLAEAIDRAPTPAFAAQLAEEYHRLLESLPDEQLRTVAVWKIEGFTNEEIAKRLGRSVATVERKLAIIRQIWQQERERETLAFVPLTPAS